MKGMITMLMLKIWGIVTLVYSFFYGFKKWFEEEKKENLAGLILAYSIIMGAMFGVIYIMNN